MAFTFSRSPDSFNSVLLIADWNELDMVIHVLFYHEDEGFIGSIMVVIDTGIDEVCTGWQAI